MYCNVNNTHYFIYIIKYRYFSKLYHMTIAHLNLELSTFTHFSNINLLGRVNDNSPKNHRSGLRTHKEYIGWYKLNIIYKHMTQNTGITTGPDEITVSLNWNKVMKQIIGSPQTVKYIQQITITHLIKKQCRYY